MRLHARERFDRIVDVVGASGSSHHADERHQKKLSHVTKGPTALRSDIPKVTIKCKAARVDGLAGSGPF